MCTRIYIYEYVYMYVGVVKKVTSLQYSVLVIAINNVVYVEAFVQKLIVFCKNAGSCRIFIHIAVFQLKFDFFECLVVVFVVQRNKLSNFC